MEVIDIMNKYGIVVLIGGLLACIICGLLKVPIAQAIRKKCLDSKIASDKLRNACTLIVAVLSIIFVALWHGLVGGITVFQDTKVYAEMLAAFTAAKVIYMLYEGFDKASIKKLIHTLIDRFRSNKVPSNNVKIDEFTDYANKVQAILTNELHMPLVNEQLDILINKLRE